MRARTTMATILGLALACPLARAQDDADSGEAKKQYLAGQKAFSAGKFTDAAQAFEAAAALKPNAVALYTAALSWEQASQAERAADDYGRAVDMTSGGPIGFERALIRYFARILSALPCCLGYLWMLWDRERRTWHDSFAHDVVVPVSSYPVRRWPN